MHESTWPQIRQSVDGSNKEVVKEAHGLGVGGWDEETGLRRQCDGWAGQWQREVRQGHNQVVVGIYMLGLVV